MAWTAPRTWVTGEVVTAALMNTHVRDNLLAVQGWMDDCSHSEPSRALDTIYQNTSGKIKVVSVSITTTAEEVETVESLTDSATPPTTVINKQGSADSTSGALRFSMTFIVLVNHYYKVAISTGSPTLLEWHEWDLLGNS